MESGRASAAFFEAQRHRRQTCFQDDDSDTSAPLDDDEALPHHGSTSRVTGHHLHSRDYRRSFMLTELNRHADEDSSGPGLRNRKKGEKQQQQPQHGTLEKRESGAKEGKNEEDGDKQSESEQEDEGEDEDEEEVVKRGVKHEFSLPEIRIAYPPRDAKGGKPHKARRLLYFADTKDKVLAFFGIFFAVAAGGHSVVWFYFMGKLNGVISNVTAAGDCEVQRKNDSHFLLNAIMAEGNRNYVFSLFAVLSWVFTCCLLLDICFRVTTYRQMERLKLVLFARLLSLHAGWYDQNDLGELVEKMTITMSQVEISVGSIVGESLYKISLAVISFATTIPLGWKLSLLINGVMIPANLFRVVVSASLRERLMLRQTKLYGEAGTVAEETLAGLSVVWAFNGQKKQIQKYDEKLDDVRKACNTAAMKIGITRGVAEMVAMGGQALAMWYMIHVSIEYPEDYGLEQFFSIFVTSLGATYLMSMGMSGLEQMLRSRSAIKSLVEIVETYSDIDPFDPAGEKPNSVVGDIEFKNVEFSYPTRKETIVLPGISFKIPAGKTYALVGESGNGKSTIVQLLLRLYDPDDGEVCLDGVNLKDLNVEWYRGQLGVVSQMPTLFCGTIRDNITGGDSRASDKDVKSAARMANIHQFINALPDKYETPVGEGGGGFSGGQKQRIAIARALFKKPKILILDEATSALDNESEKVVQRALDNARKGRTTLVIAHRLSTVRDADVIVVLDKGRILEKGNHEQLMNIKGMYYALVKEQTTEAGMPVVPEVEEPKLESTDSSRRPDFTMPGTLPGTKRINIGGVTGGGNRFDGDGSVMNVFAQRIRSSFSSKVSLRSLSIVGSKTENGSEVKTDDSDENQEIVVKRPRTKPPGVMLKMLKWMRPNCCMFLLAIFFVILRSCEQPMNVLFLLSMIGPLEEPDAEKRRQGAWAWIIGQGALAVTVLFSFWLSYYLLIHSAQNLSCKLRKTAFASIVNRPQSWHDDPANSTAHVISALQHAGEYAPCIVFDFLVFYIESTSTCICACSIAMATSWLIGLPFLGLIPVILTPFFISTAVNRPKKDEIMWDVEAEIYAVETLQNMRTVTVLGLERRRYAIYAEMLESWIRQKRRKIFPNSLCFALDYGCLGKASALSVLFWGVFLMQNCNHDVQLSNVYTCSIAVISAGDYIIDQACKLPNLGEVKRFAQTILDYIDDGNSRQGNEYDQQELSGDFTINDDAFTGEIEFDHVAFRYPTRSNVRVLEDFNVAVKPGEMMALVGASGGGKSTVIKMMERFYNPMRGEIRLDGSNLKKFDISWLRSHIGLVGQDPILFSGTITENIAFGEGGESFTKQDIIAAAVEANCHNFVTTLPHAYDTPVGHKGSALSGGQRQRVCIARALLRRPKILLLDEATSALDNASEKIVQEALDGVIKGRTVVTIAHRLSTIQNADKIAVIGQGRIMEIGTHNALMEKRGIYYGLHKAASE